MEPAQRNTIAKFAGSESAKLTCMPLSLFHRSLFLPILLLDSSNLYFILLRNLTNFSKSACCFMTSAGYACVRWVEKVFHSEAAAATATTTTRSSQRVDGEKFHMTQSVALQQLNGVKALKPSLLEDKKKFVSESFPHCEPLFYPEKIKRVSMTKGSFFSLANVKIMMMHSNRVISKLNHSRTKLPFVSVCWCAIADNSKRWWSCVRV